jgi:hypothetical protein
VGFHCYAIGLPILPEFSAWAAAQNVPMWCSEETNWLGPLTDLALALSPNTRLVVYYEWPKPADPPPFLAPAPLPTVNGSTPTAPAPQVVLPATPTIIGHPGRRTRRHSATFSFDDSTAKVAYQCRRDRQSWGTCSTPKRYSGLTHGKHTFHVRAIVARECSGAASFTWTIKR